LWQITSYRTAVDTELEVQRATTLLQARYGRRWRRRAPGHLVWMLRNGADVANTCEQVRALVDVEDRAASAETISSMSSGDAAQSGPDTTELPPTPAPSTDSAWVGTDDPPLPMDDVDDRLDEALELNRRHWMETGRTISAETLRQRLHISANASRDLTRAVRAADRAAILAMPPGGSINVGDHERGAADRIP
jgi:hypothetical protein